LIIAWARSAVAPVGGAFRGLHAHEIGAPVLKSLLQRAGISPEAVDAVVIGNALGAGGNPARMLALAAGLPDRCAALSVDTQCCSGLDAIAMAVGLLASGQASVVIAGGVEAWSRAPLRHTRPQHAGEAPVPYERPAFAPEPARDPDLLDSAAGYAAQQGITRVQQDAYALLSHQRAMQHQDFLRGEMVEINGLQHDAYPRALTPQRAARMPVAVQRENAADCAVSTLAISTRADGAALVLLATPEACKTLGLTPQAAWLASASVGADPSTPLLAAQVAAQAAMQRAGLHSAADLQAIELHDAFAVQGLSFCRALGLEPDALNRHGGGLARGHPIGASGAIALVRLLADLQGDESPGARGLAAVAGAGGIGAAVVIQRL
jgi:acetyl-CoA C-acetyltransferase